MKKYTKEPGVLRRAKRALRRWTAAAAEQRVVKWAFYTVACLILSAVPVADGVSPLAAALLSAAASFPAQTAALIGSCGGALLFGGIRGGVWAAAAALLIYGGSCAVRRRYLWNTRWFMPVLCAVVGAAVAAVRYRQTVFAPGALTDAAVFALSLAGGCVVFRWAVLSRRTWAQLILAGCLLAGLTGMQVFGLWIPGVSVAFCLAAAACPTVFGMVLAAVGGITLELMTGAAPYTAILCALALIGFVLRRQEVVPRITVLLAANLAISWVLFRNDPAYLLSTSLGVLAALAVPPRLFLPVSPDRTPQLANTVRRLDEAAQVLGKMSLELETQPDSGVQPDAAAIFDRAAEQVCRNCSRWNTCWEQESSDTYRMMAAVAPKILQRSQAVDSDFPETFQCQHMEQLLAAINRELADTVCRRQYHSRQAEQQAVLSGQYRALERYLHDTAAALEQPAVPEARYAPEIGVSALGRNGSMISGDRGACFYGPNEEFFVLLCDGMGTGPAAGAQAAAAVETLSGLLQAGMDAQCAVETLNGIYVLRDNGCFSTVDLLQLSLTTAQGMLLKWGAAPSYLRRGGSVKRLGTASVPPGLEVGGDHSGVQRIRLSLQEGDLLVLTSDGAGESAQERIACLQETSAKEAAAQILKNAGENGGDDQTVVAICLHSASSV